MVETQTLLFASVSARAGFIIIFLIASFRSEARVAFCFWTASIVGSSIGMLLIYSDPNYPYFLATRGMWIYIIIGFSLSSLWAGGHAFFGGAVNKAGVALMGLVPGVIYGIARTSGLMPDVAVALTIAALSVFTAAGAYPFVRRRRRRYLPSQLLVGGALSAYAIALAASFLLIMIRLHVSGAVPAPGVSDISLALFIDQLMSVLVYVGLVAMSLEDVQMRMKELAAIDPLSGLANRRGVQDRALDIIGACQRVNRPISVLLMDLDHFKSINDRYGHGGGDIVLREFARRLSLHCRHDDDVTGRWGGEEFLALLSNMTLSEAAAFAERFCHSVSLEPFNIGDQEFSVTVSIGVAEIDLSAPRLDQTLKAADEALYEAKRRGRNRVHTYPNFSNPPLAPRDIIPVQNERLGHVLLSK
ncbi:MULTISPECIES: GGDEF domain-containing protein [Rhizobium/Agrobacterium group]|uniref:GGDEF domain-containing protein n=1 Tax=Rhizobium/Agrobacterium group TaxID=227290 RepID=UPI001ADCDD29|nr:MULTISPECIES: GGDEF domain-containing protein [Rhizobium/Agrobacterium group]MBO9112451.1 GGDEF domain-containing protein [Agrobacterium sp. S2/73]QXZ75960.1 GGDEF domain-containing protein [Agrobacterium sp. S7/73]QYA17029.1 GGDEF domain-containing protein [Rhizobium sp. AB2/73]UEQ85398.1 GGDEF domain-containing protein [Rhizobium sp. AB2/73]